MQLGGFWRLGGEDAQAWKKSESRETEGQAEEIRPQKTRKPRSQKENGQGLSIFVEKVSGTRCFCLSGKSKMESIPEKRGFHARSVENSRVHRSAAVASPVIAKL